MEDILVEPRTLAGSDALAERFRALYRAEYPRVAGYAYRLTRDTEQANDIAQEAFTRLLSRFVGVREPRAYVFHVATNLARAAWHARVRAERAAPDLAAGGVEAAPDRSVADAIARLPRRHREVVLLHYYADLAVADVAEAVRRPAGTVKRQLAEARALLAQSLGDRHE
ncbi:MAG TPA: sigma-70 family RNA polymerase sigma factor [Frankiaceae bacterium]|nr:sigma-70 family RNA polymerase sigma factor [Frankiaceae bacterium]